MTTWNAAPMPELGLELVRDVDRERIRSRLPRWDPRLWGHAQFSKNTRPGNRLLKLGLAWGRERVKARKLQQENVTPAGDVAPVSRFTGKEEDVEVGLTYFGKRYLSPYLGRWISADPLAVHAPGEADLNLYAYVHGHVLKSVDPQGLQEVPLGGWSDPTAVLNQKSEQAIRWAAAKSANAAAVAGVALGCARFPTACRHIALGTAMATAGNHKELARNVGEYVAFEIGAKAVGVVGGKLVRTLAKTEVEALEHGVKAATLSERVGTAAKFFRDAGIQEKNLGAYLQGIDLTKEVRVRQLYKGDVVTQFQAPGSPTGRWFAPRGTAADTLGINAENRVASTYVVKEDMKVLESTAADTTGNPWVRPRTLKAKVVVVSTSRLIRRTCRKSNDESEPHVLAR